MSVLYTKLWSGLVYLVLFLISFLLRLICYIIIYILLLYILYISLYTFEDFWNVEPKKLLEGFLFSTAVTK
jgi:hypothetical protein